NNPVLRNAFTDISMVAALLYAAANNLAIMKGVTTRVGWFFSQFSISVETVNPFEYM
ncbi:hypothetical protein L9F63_002493, partial [Diploptera punctata]